MFELKCLLKVRYLCCWKANRQTYAYIEKFYKKLSLLSP